MSRNLIHHWRLQRSIERRDSCASHDESELSATDLRYISMIRSAERRLQREAALAERAPSRTIRQRTMQEIYDLEFHRRHRRLPWWQTTRGGSSLVAACVLLAGVIFALLTIPGERRAPEKMALDPRPNLSETRASAGDPSGADADAPFDLIDNAIEIRTMVNPEWVLRAFSPQSIRQEISDIADEAWRAADYIVSRFTFGPDGVKPARPNPPTLPGTPR